MRGALVAVAAGAAAWAPAFRYDALPRRPTRRAAATTHGDQIVVALTREAGKNGGLARALAEHHIETVEVPCVSTQRTPQMDALLESALLFAEDPWDWDVVTSPEAAKTFGAAVARAGLGATRDAKWRAFRLAAVGGATAAALDACQDLRPWRGSSFTPATATAAALAKALPDDSGRRVLFPASALAAPTVWKSKFYGAFVLNHASTSTPSTRHLLDGVAMSVLHRSTEPARPRHAENAPDTLVDFHTGADARGRAQGEKLAVTRVDAYTTAPAPWSPEDAAAAASATSSPSARRPPRASGPRALP